MELGYKKRNLYLVMAITLIIMVVALWNDFNGVLDGLSKANIYWLLLAVFLIFVFWFFEALAYYIIFKVTVKKIKFFLIMKLTVATQFFNGVTPFASGGQPFQIYILNKKTKVSYGKVTSVSLQNFIVYQISLVLYGLIVLLIHFTSKSNLIKSDRHMDFLILIGFLLNFLVIAGLLILSKSKKLSKFLSINILNFLGKIRIVKNVDEKREKLLGFLHEFHDTIEELSSHKKTFLLTIFINLIKLTVFYSVSYVLCLSVGLYNINYLSVILASAYTMLITSLVPLPGASGGAELGFLAFFGSMIPGSTGTVIMLLWRFITYYVGLALGFLVFTFGFNKDETISGI